MGKLIARLVVTLGVVYGLGATAFAFLHYEGAKPDVPTILTDFNDYLLSVVKSRPGPDAANQVPAPPEPPSEATPTAEPKLPVPVEPADPAAEELKRIRTDLIPKAQEAARKLRNMDRSDSARFEDARTDLLGSIGDARSFLNGLLEKEPRHKAANELLGTLNGIYQAVRHL